jgi:hypothetical protein
VRVENLSYSKAPFLPQFGDGIAKNKQLIVHPTNRLFAVMDEIATPEQALNELSRIGFTNGNVEIFYGQIGAQSGTTPGAKGSLFTQLRHAFQGTTIEQGHAQHYEQVLLMGQYVVAVQIDHVGQREQVREILHRHGGQFINFYGKSANGTV